MCLKDKLVTKLPTIEATESFWFSNSEGQLLTEDPRQKQLFPAPAVVPSAEVVQVQAPALVAVSQ